MRPSSSSPSLPPRSPSSTSARADSPSTRARSGFIAIESIRLRKWGEARLANGGTVKPDSVYAAPTEL